jgi:hypothetical protein
MPVYGDPSEEKLNPWGEELVRDVLAAYPQLTRKEAIEILRAFGGL